MSIKGQKSQTVYEEMKKPAQDKNPSNLLTILPLANIFVQNCNSRSKNYAGAVMRIPPPSNRDRFRTQPAIPNWASKMTVNH